MKRVSKTQIKNTLRTMETTKIFAVAKKAGVDVNSYSNVFNFIKENAPTQKVLNNAYSLSYGANDFKLKRMDYRPVKQPIKKAIEWAKYQIKAELLNTNYAKVLIEGNNHIYWASPTYGHKDYNKSVAFENTPKNKRVAQLINRVLEKNK